MKIRQMSKLLAMILAVIMLAGMVPVHAFASYYDDANGGSDYYKVISEKKWDIAPGVEEFEQVVARRLKRAEEELRAELQFLPDVHAFFLSKSNNQTIQTIKQFPRRGAPYRRGHALRRGEPMIVPTPRIVS